MTAQRLLFQDRFKDCHAGDPASDDSQEGANATSKYRGNGA
jgi:hypothetical protein